MKARRSVWSDPQVVELLQSFVPAADEVYRLQKGGDAECRLFQKIAEQGHYAGRDFPSSTRQGTYAAAPSGVLLASVNSNDPAAIAVMLERALDKWDALPPEERLLPDDPQDRAPELRRAERLFPEEGLILRVNSRDLPREAEAADWRGKAWNQDYAWFTKAEARQFLPEQPVVGQRHDLPAPLVRRLVRLHLVDNVRGQTQGFSEADVKTAWLTGEVVGVEGDIVSLRLEGETRAEADGRWSVNGDRDMSPPQAQKRGFKTRLRGNAQYDRKQERFVAFEMVAVGMRWGGTRYNVRNDDLDPAPIGVAFTLAGGAPAERVAPAFFWEYGWR